MVEDYIDFKQYCEERLDNQIEWYSQKSTWNKNWHYGFKILEILITSLISIGTLYVNFCYFKIIVSVLGILLIAIYNAHTFFKFQENWIEYRKTSEILKHEKYMFLACSGIYNTQDNDIPFKILVERCETIISHENINWAQLNNNEYGEQCKNHSSTGS